MNKKQIKENAQTEIMHMLSNTLLAYQESNNVEHDASDSMQAEIMKQMERVAKLMGYVCFVIASVLCVSNEVILCFV